MVSRAAVWAVVVLRGAGAAWARSTSWVSLRKREEAGRGFGGGQPDVQRNDSI